MVCMPFSQISSQNVSDKTPWKSIFNGKDFSGWKIIGSNGKAWVHDNEIVCHMVSNTPEHTFVCTKKKYADFILEAECKLDGDFHTGFLLRCMDAKADTAQVSLYGYQVKIDPTSRKWTGGVFDDYGKTWEWYYPLKNSEAARAAFKMNEWNTFRIEAIGNEIKVWVNGIPTTNLKHDKYKKGYIALKIHSMGNNPEKEKILVHYRNLKIIDKNAAKYAQPMNYPVLDFTSTE